MTYIPIYIFIYINSNRIVSSLLSPTILVEPAELHCFFKEGRLRSSFPHKFDLYPMQFHTNNNGLSRVNMMLLLSNCDWAGWIFTIMFLRFFTQIVAIWLVVSCIKFYANWWMKISRRNKSVCLRQFWLSLPNCIVLSKKVGSNPLFPTNSICIPSQFHAINNGFSRVNVVFLLSNCDWASWIFSIIFLRVFTQPNFVLVSDQCAKFSVGFWTGHEVLFGFFLNRSRIFFSRVLKSRQSQVSCQSFLKSGHAPFQSKLT